MRRLLPSLLGLLAIGLAHGQGSVTGQYQLRVPEDAVKVARLAGKGTPGGALTLHATGRFVLEAGDRVRHGRYRVEDDHLTLDVDDGSVLGGLVRDGRVTLEGLEFAKGSGSAPSVRRFPTDVSTGRLRRVDGVLTAGDPAPAEITRAPILTPAPVVVPRAAPVFAPDPVVPVAPAVRPAPVRHLEAKEVSGLWTVRRNGLEEKGLKMDLRGDGTFRFSMTGATSEGTWTCANGDVVLVWTKIDGDVVETGAVRKTIAVADDASAFQIDTYRYERATDK